MSVPPIPANDLVELAERCEKATGPETGVMLDEAFEAVHGYTADAGDLAQPEFAQTFSFLLEARAYLDAAMTLVPEGNPGLEITNHYGNPWRALVYPDGDGGPISEGLAATPALALTAAALRARGAA